MAFYNFKRLISKYSAPFKVVVKEGQYNEVGDYVDGSSEIIDMVGAIIGFKQSRIYRSEGNLTTKDKHLFLNEPIDNALIGSFVIYKGEKYTIESETENASFTDVYAYTLKFVSSFNDYKEVSGND